jgi:hypothetical protein
MPEPVIIANRPFWARIFAIFWLIEIAAGLGFAASCVAAKETGVAIALAVGGLLLAAVGTVMAASSLRIWRLKGPAIAMSGEGLIDNRIAPQSIPWTAITYKVVFNSRAYSLQFDVDPPAREAIDVYWEHRLMGKFNRLLKFPELTVLTLGTGRSAHEIAGLMARFRPEGNQV